MIDKIIFNGRAYRDETEMPATVREKYLRLNAFFRDANQDGVLDFLQENGLKGIKEVFEFAKDISRNGNLNTRSIPNQIYSIQVFGPEIVINGRSFPTINDMPPDIRENYERIIREVEPGNSDYYNEPRRIINRDENNKSLEDRNHSSHLDIDDQAPSIHQNINSDTGVVILVAVTAMILCIVAIWFVTNGIIIY